MIGDGVRLDHHVAMAQVNYERLQVVLQQMDDIEAKIERRVREQTIEGNDLFVQEMTNLRCAKHKPYMLLHGEREVLFKKVQMHATMAVMYAQAT